MDDSDRRLPGAAPRVRQVAVPPAARALSTLARIDYADTFVLDTGPDDRTPEEWARAILEGAPVTVRTKLLLGWSAIGLKLVDDRSGRSVLGWAVRSSSPEFVLLGADSRIGMPGELLFKSGHALQFATFVQQDNLVARAVWAATEPAHVRVVRQVLEQAGRRILP
ncbi:MAG: hypothetical protein QOE41_3957 [Mycobacterium sp.]|jgi:hypothetical protein|nr:hypothetical protein [Mycobacterium sp.]MDT5134646.1 hypothetical protein [Mycobacterium sp.]